MAMVRTGNARSTARCPTARATWLVFGAYLHVAGRRDRWATIGPWLIVLGFAGVLFTYVGAGLFIVGEHSYGAG